MGLEGCTPKQNRRLLLTTLNPPCGTQNHGKPSANEGGKNVGSRGLCPLAGGSGDVPPQTFKRGELLTPFKPAIEWDSKPWQTLSQRGRAKMGVQGAAPPGRGLGGMCPRKTSKG